MNQLRTELKRKRTGSGRKWPLAVAVIFFGLFFCIAAQPAWAGFYTDPWYEDDGSMVTLSQKEGEVKDHGAKFVIKHDGGGASDWIVDSVSAP
mgnify:FL=1